jgi:hypothetical protein
MGLYLRKSVSVGPFRFNLSGSGIGISVGVPGFRIGSSPRGNYVHMGLAGVYYRATIPCRAAKPALPARPSQPFAGASNVEMREIESAAATSIVDIDSAAVVQELNSKRQKWRLWPWVSVLGVTLLVVLLSKQPAAPIWLAWSCIAIASTSIFAAWLFDRVRKTTVLMYEFEPSAESDFITLHAAFDSLVKCSRTWHVSAEGKVHARKYHAGASSLVKRKSVSLNRGNPPFVKTNVSVPFIPVGKQTLYFLPDMVLVVEANAVGAVSYGTLNLKVSQTRFIEEDGVPGDAKVVDRTWRYVNKKGGPDRRFKDNRELPIVLYGELSLSSDSGLEEVIQLSQIGVGEGLVSAVHAIATGRTSR